MKMRPVHLRKVGLGPDDGKSLRARTQIPFGNDKPKSFIRRRRDSIRHSLRKPRQLRDDAMETMTAQSGCDGFGLLISILPMMSSPAASRG